MKTSFRSVILTVFIAALLAVAAVGFFDTSAQSERRSKRSADESVAASLSPVSPSAPFTAGNLVIYRVGDGAAALTSNATPVFLDEYTIGGTVAQSIALPTAVSGSNRRLTASGTSTSEGFISRSSDGRYLVFAGYDATLGTASITSSTSGTVNRVIGRVNTDGTVDTSTALTDAISGGNPRSVASTNGVDFWLSGTSTGGGIRYASQGATTSTSLATTPTNLRVAGIFGGQLYITASTGTTRIAAVGTGTPTTAGQTITNVPGSPTTGAPYGFFFADLSAGVAGLDTLYVADDTPGTVTKYSLVAGNWTVNNSVSITTARGLAGSVSGSTVTLFVTNGSTLQTVTDTSGYNANISGSPSVLATAPTNTAFRGVALVPTVAPPEANADYNGDGRTDYAIARPAGGAGLASGLSSSFASKRDRLRTDRSNLFRKQASGDSLVAPPIEWWVAYNNAAGGIVQTLGDIQSDFIISEDFDGDRKDDFAVWRPGAALEAGFYIINSSDGTFEFSQFGQDGDDPSVVGDYDGDGKADEATFRCPQTPGTCYFFYRGTLNNPTQGITYIPWGFGTLDDYIPNPGDFNGDGKYDFCLQDIRNPQVVFWIWYPATSTYEGIQWGLNSDFLAPGDYDGDGRSDLAVFRYEGSNLVFYVLERDGGIRAVQWGLDSDAPAPGDYDGDGRQDIAVYRGNGSDATFWVLPSNGSSAFTFNWGLPTDTPVAGWYVQ